MKELVQFLVQQLVNQPDAPPSQMNAHGAPRRTRRRPPHPTPVGQKPPSHRKGGVIAEHKAHYVLQSRGPGGQGAVLSRRVTPHSRDGSVVYSTAGTTCGRAILETDAVGQGKAQRILPPIRPRAKGRRSIARFEDARTGSTRSFCSRCGPALLYERKRSLHMVNIPRALFTGRTGREPRYHVAIEELQDWAYTGKRLVPLKGYRGVVWERPKSRRRPRNIDDLEFLDRRVPFARARIVQ